MDPTGNFELRADEKLLLGEEVEESKKSKFLT
jgi:hypothetical protein